VRSLSFGDHVFYRDIGIVERTMADSRSASYDFAAQLRRARDLDETKRLP
jgi:hypothetical protein